MITTLSLAEHTLLAELSAQSLDTMFDDQFPENGTFVTRSVKNREGRVREYFYYQGYRPGHSDGKERRFSKYVGPADDPQLRDRVARFRTIKAGRKQRRKLVGALAGAGLPRPPVAMGRIIEALAKAGVFRLRAVLVGTAAFQTYPALTGMRFDTAAAITADVDIAQFRSISIGVEDSTPPLLDVLQGIDPTFRAVPHANDAIRSAVFENAQRFRLDILTAHRGSDDQMGRPMTMDALTGAAAEPLRFMDYLIRDAVRSVVLHGPGISVNVPTPERFAIHKLIISGERLADAAGQAKRRKDLVQAGDLALALEQTGRRDVLGAAFEEAWERGPRWRSGIVKGALSLPGDAWTALNAASDERLASALANVRARSKSGRDAGR